MRVTLLHNPKAGYDSPAKDELKKLLKKADYKVDYESVKKKDWEEALEDPGDLVVVAGGDGTIAKVATRLAGSGTPMAILPVGTANNIATSLGIRGSPEELIAGWETAHRRKLDIGVASGPWGETRFVEAVGLGLFTHSMALVEARAELEAPEDRDEELVRDLKFLQMTLSDSRSRAWQITLDGEDLSDEYFLLEILNVPCIGPNLCMAPEASPGDGRLDLVLLTEEYRARFAEYLTQRIEGEMPSLELPARSGRRVELRWEGSPMRVDDHLYADATLGNDTGGEAGQGEVVQIWIESEVEVLVSSE
jgi:diacylglycerol kinase (ATP)